MYSVDYFSINAVFLHKNSFFLLQNNCLWCIVYQVLTVFLSNNIGKQTNVSQQEVKFHIKLKKRKMYD